MATLNLPNDSEDNKPKYYVVIIEHKAEAPLVIESKLMSYNQAAERMRALSSDSKIIRVAMAKLEYEGGNEKTLLNR